VATIEIVGRPDVFQAAYFTAKDKPVAGERLIVKFLPLQPVARKALPPGQTRKIPDVTLIHQCNLRMLVEQRIEQGGAGAENTHDKHRIRRLCFIYCHC